MLASWLQQQKEKFASKLPLGTKANSGSENSPTFHLQSLIHSARNYAKGRVELAKAELWQLFEQFKPVLALALLLIFLGVCLGILLEVAIFASLLHFLSWPAYLVALVMIGAHVLLLLIFGMALRSKLKALKPFAQSQNLQQRPSQTASHEASPTTETASPSESPLATEVSPPKA